MKLMLHKEGSKQVSCLPSALFARDSIYFLLDPYAKETIRDIKQSRLAIMICVFAMTKNLEGTRRTFVDR